MWHNASSLNFKDDKLSCSDLKLKRILQGIAAKIVLILQLDSYRVAARIPNGFLRTMLSADAAQHVHRQVFLAS